MKRDLIKEITDFKKRLVTGDKYESYEKLSLIENIIEFLKSVPGKFKYELLKYIPIGTAVIIQNFFRAIIAELINSGKPYTDNLAKFNDLKNYKMDFQVFSAINNKSVTIGEFVSHLTSLNNLDEINSCISLLLNQDFLSELKKIKDSCKPSIDEEFLEMFKKSSDAIYGDVKKIFNMRHIFAHELGTTITFDENVIYRCFENVSIFLKISDNYVSNLLHPNLPVSMIEITEYFLKELEQNKIKLIKVINTIRISLEEEIVDSFDKANEEWEKFIESEAKAQLKLFEGGTIYDVEYSNFMISKIKSRIDTLQEDYRDWLTKTEPYQIE